MCFALIGWECFALDSSLAPTPRRTRAHGPWPTHTHTTPHTCAHSHHACTLAAAAATHHTPHTTHHSIQRTLAADVTSAGFPSPL
jgi:hypothetical protein